MIKVNGKEVVFESFPNGETRLVVESIERDWSLIYPTVSFKFENDSDLIKLMFVKEYLDSLKIGAVDLINAVNLVIYYMPYSRMDRSENGSPFTLKYVSKFINGLGFDSIEVVEPHSDVTCALLDKVEAKYINFDLLPKVMKEVEFDEEYDFIMFPDLGASKRYSKMKAKNVLIGHKNRDFVTGDILGLELMGDTSKANKQNVIIVDDLSSYGGTFVHSAKALREKGFRNIYLLIAHAENSIFKKELFNHIDKVFTTDTILTEHLNWENVKNTRNKLHVYEIAKILQEMFDKNNE